MATTPAVPAVSKAAALREPAGWGAACKALALTIAFRIFYSLVAALFSPHLTLNEKLIRSNRLTEHLMSRASHPVLYALLGVWERFDTLWYIEIARHGYDMSAATVFYPLYPALIRAVSVITRSELAAAVLISTTATFFLFWGALRLFEYDESPASALRAILLWALWPAAFMLFAGYPDSLLCALTLWSILLARSEQWRAAGVAGFFAGLTKAMGCLVALPLLWMAWKRRDRRGMLAAAMSVAGVACFQGWLAVCHFPTAGDVYRTWWATSTVAPWITLADALRAAMHFDIKLWLNLVVLAVVGVAGLLPSVRVEYRAYAVAAMCLFLTKHTEPLLQSSTRYSLAIFAAYPTMAARLGRRVPFVVSLLLAATVNLVLMHSFLEWGLVV